MRPRLIGLYSPVAQSGKSEVAKLLNRHGFVTVKFAEPLKAMVRALLVSVGLEDFVEDMVEGDLKEQFIQDLGTTPRFLMQTLGTEWGRNTVYNDFWVRAALAKVGALQNSGKSVVIDDLRFDNEFEAIKRAGGDCWRVWRPGAQRNSTAHPSEGLLESMRFDRHIINDATLDHLRGIIADAIAFG